MGSTLGNGPFLNGSCHNVSNGRIEAFAIVDDAFEFFVGILGQGLAHVFQGEDIFAKHIVRPLRRAGALQGGCGHGLKDSLCSCL